MSDQVPGMNDPRDNNLAADQPAHPANAGGGAGGPLHIDPEEFSLYAMEFLTGDDAAAIVNHLAGCAECRAELAQIRGDLAAYAFTAEMRPVPGSARERLMTQVAAEKKAVPAPVLVAAPVTDAQPALAAFGRQTSILTSDDDEDERPRRNMGMAVLGWSGWAIAAGMTVVAGGLYKQRVSLRDTLASRTSQIQSMTATGASAHQLMDALTDPKALRVTLTAKPQKAEPIGGVTYDPAKGSLVLLANNLDALQTSKVYELWLIPADGGAPIPAGTFHPDEQGSASVIMPELPKGVSAKAFGVTVEDAGGSQTPTLPIVMAGKTS